MRAGEVFVFAGAGVSVSPPAGLPAFAGIRDAILGQLGLPGYIVTGDRGPVSEQQRAAAGLAPEPFLLALQRDEVYLVPWLRLVLSDGSPNAAHAALAQVAAAGAAVWTVNFDTLIEDAAGHRLNVSPRPPMPSCTSHTAPCQVS
ncbi:MAG: hypothetical protein ACJ786_12945 [Catenulispora sp.]